MWADIQLKGLWFKNSAQLSRGHIIYQKVSFSTVAVPRIRLGIGGFSSHIYLTVVIILYYVSLYSMYTIKSGTVKTS